MFFTTLLALFLQSPAFATFTSTPTPSTCTFPSSQLFAVAQNGNTVQLGMIPTITVPKVGFAVLSAGPGSKSEVYFEVKNGVLLPYVNEYQKPVSLPIQKGESPTFVSSYPYPLGSTGFCVVPNKLASSPSLLKFNDENDWALCKNATAGGRQDVVFSPVAGHAHYSLPACVKVDIQARNL